MTRSSFRPKPKSKEPFYSVSPAWRDIIPIPLIDGPPLKPGESDPGPALATIAYSPRYLEAMSYLRAVMAKNEFSRRALELTEDIISMNPAHYTVWLYRVKILKALWERDGDVEGGVMRELDWLEGVSERNLKNYQIWCVASFCEQVLDSLIVTVGTCQPASVCSLRYRLMFFVSASRPAPTEDLLAQSFDTES